MFEGDSDASELMAGLKGLKEEITKVWPSHTQGSSPGSFASLATQ